jgi:3-oxoacyl-[acyl-carrier-protein] synthase II
VGRRVVVTGLGTVNSLGNTVPEFWEGVRAGKSGIGPITKFDATGYPSRIAGEVKNFEATERLDPKFAKRSDPFSHFALASALEAMRQAGLWDGEEPVDAFDPSRAGVVIGSGIGGFQSLGDAFKTLFDRGHERILPTTIPKIIGNIAVAHVAMTFNAMGPSTAPATACAAGADGIGYAKMWIENGYTDLMIAGGTEACITPLAVGAFGRIHALSTGFNDTPEVASRPFDRDRDGFVFGEGAGILVLESLEHAQKRGATILAELVGFGATNDAHHLTAPHPEGTGAYNAMKMALDNGGVGLEEIDYINAHGTSTPLNDPTETAAIKKLFGDHAYKLKVSSTKSMTGHCIGGTGAVEAVAAVMAIHDQLFPSTRNLENPDPACDLDYVPDLGTTGTIRAVLSNSFGFGGHNSALVFRAYEA